MTSQAIVRSSFLQLSVIFFAAANLTTAANAQSYPSKPITVISAFAPGSSTDISTRAIAQKLSEALGQQVIVDNKPGANGVIAAQAVQRAEPSGYTLLATTNSIVAAPSLMKSVTYTMKDFTPITPTGNIPAILAINGKLPHKAVAELTTYAKAHPGELSYAGGASLPIIAGATYGRRAGINLKYVPYKSTPQALTDVLSGEISMMFIDVQTSKPLIQAGQLRGLALTTKERSALWPDMPTMQEAGVSDFDINSWQGWFGPANMPKEVAVRLNTEIRKILENPEMKKQFEGRGVDMFYMTSDEFTKFVGEQSSLWQRLVKDSGIEPE